MVISDCGSRLFGVQVLCSLWHLKLLTMEFADTVTQWVSFLTSVVNYTYALSALTLLVHCQEGIKPAKIPAPAVSKDFLVCVGDLA